MKKRKYPEQTEEESEENYRLTWHTSDGTTPISPNAWLQGSYTAKAVPSYTPHVPYTPYTPLVWPSEMLQQKEQEFTAAEALTMIETIYDYAFSADIEVEEERIKMIRDYLIVKLKEKV